jgi:hypothetical protein
MILSRLGRHSDALYHCTRAQEFANEDYREQMESSNQSDAYKALQLLAVANHIMAVENFLLNNPEEADYCQAQTERLLSQHSDPLLTRLYKMTTSKYRELKSV